jgi:hypothetical protein
MTIRALASQGSPLLLVLGVLGGLGASGCEAPLAGPGLRLSLVARPQGVSGCLTLDGQPLPPTDLRGQGGTVRVSVVKRDAQGAPSFVCDAVARVPDERPNLALDAGGTYELYAEWFDPAGARAAQGFLPTLSQAEQQGVDPLPLPLFGGGWSCPPGGLKEGRAFHSATLLPWGEVLLIGGLTAMPEQGPSTFQLLNSSEVYDPRTGRTVEVKDQDPGVVPKARAFHHAAILDYDGVDTVRLLISGGLTAPLRRPALEVPGQSTQLRLAATGTTEPSPAAVLTYSRQRRQYTSRRTLAEVEHDRVTYAGGLPLPPQDGGGLLTVGGQTFPKGREVEGTRSLLAENRRATLTRAAAPASAPGPVGEKTQGLDLQPWLVAPSVTMTGPGTALVLGAARPLPMAMSQDVTLSALLLGGVAPGGTLRVETSGTAPGAPTVFHTATALRSGEETRLLVTGGFVMQFVGSFEARQPPAAEQAVRLYRLGWPLQVEGITPYGPAQRCGAAEDHYRPAGFEAATATVSGERALVSGGTPTAAPAGCQDCEPGDTGTIKLLCTTRQASLFDLRTRKLEQAPQLGLGRMGHRQTLLPEGNILVTGGLVRPGGDLTPATGETEVYNPRPAAAGDDTDDPVQPLLKAQGLSRSGMGEARPCNRL